MSKEKSSPPRRGDHRGETLRGLRPPSAPAELRSSVLDASGAALRSAAPAEEIGAEAPEADHLWGGRPWVTQRRIDRVWESRPLRLGWLAAAALLLALNLYSLDDPANPATVAGATLLAEAHDDELLALPGALGGIRGERGRDPRRGLLNTWTLTEVRQQLSSEEWL